MSRAVILLCGLLLTTSAFGQEMDQMPFDIPSPDRWAQETIALPPDFAPDMAWHGTEELRFAPRWMKADSANFFSYTLLFWLPGNQTVDAPTLQAQLLTYYRGLAKAVSESKEQTIDVAPFTMTVKESAPKPAARPSGEEVIAFTGELNWIEPFVTAAAQTLRMDIHTWRSEVPAGRCVFICASPQPESAEVWKSLRAIRGGVAPETGETEETTMKVHYIEIVCRDVNAQCASLERVHGLRFGTPVADLGGARVANAADGSLIGVRAPLAEYEQPIIRTYMEVEDIAKAIKEAETAGGVVAYPPSKQGDTGTWAIYSLGDVQFGLWQK